MKIADNFSDFGQVYHSKIMKHSQDSHGHLLSTSARSDCYSPCSHSSSRDSNNSPIHPVDLEKDESASEREVFLPLTKPSKGPRRPKMDTKLYCIKENVSKYIKITPKLPKKGDGQALGVFQNIWDSRPRPQKKSSKIESNDDDTKGHILNHDVKNWQVISKWSNQSGLVQNLESNGKRFSAPISSSVSLEYLEILKENIEVVDDDHHHSNPHQKLPAKEQEQSIYLDDDENSTFFVKFYPKSNIWVISDSHLYRKLNIGKAVGTIFSQVDLSEEGKVSIEKLKEIIEDFSDESSLTKILEHDKFDDRESQAVTDVSQSQRSKDNDLGLEGGLLSDLKRKSKFYLSDFTDALNLQCLSSIIFCYFVNITPIITFGAMTQDDTEGNIGAVESLIGAGMCGCIWALFSGQPLIIITQTGPMLVFDRILYALSRSEYFTPEEGQGISFLEFRAFIGLWTGFFCILIVVFKLSKYVKFITKFTEESFASLIALIFMVDGIKKILNSIDIKQRPGCEDLPVCSEVWYGSSGTNVSVSDTSILENETVQSQLSQEIMTNDTSFVCEHLLTSVENKDLCLDPNQTDQFCPLYQTCKQSVGYFSMLLSLTTLFFCFFFKNLRNQNIFPTFIRKQLADFGVVLSILIGILVNNFVNLPTFKLKVPSSFTTTVGRAWLVPFSSFSGQENLKFLFLAAIPAFLCTVLVFLDQQITAVIVNRKQNKLKKGHGYHLDLLIVGILIPICGLLGLPFYVAATVQSIAHVHSLRVYDEDSSSNSQQGPKGVIEQRVTCFTVFALIFTSVFASKYLKFIPINVLYGVFVYLGITTLIDLSIYERILLLFTPVKHQEKSLKSKPYLRKVSLKAVNSFTVLQIICIGVLFFIKSYKKISIGFPLMILVIVLVRRVLDYFYSREELEALDGH